MVPGGIALPAHEALGSAARRAPGALLGVSGTIMARHSGPERRQFPRYPTRHRVEGESLDSGIALRGTLQDFSAAGCCLRLDRPLPPGTRIELRCDINGLGLRIIGRVVWAEETAAGVFHGIALAGPESEEDALFHRLYLGRLARQADGAE